MTASYSARLLRDEPLGGGVHRLRWHVDGMPSFSAGQYTALIGADDRPVYFTIVSPPGELPELELHYAATPDSPDVASMAAIRHAGHAQLLPAMGQVTFAAQPDARRWLVIAAATGISQALALTQAPEAAQCALAVYWGVRSADALYPAANDTLAQRAQHRRAFDYLTVVSDDVSWSGRRGLVVDAAIADGKHQWAERVVLAGSPPMVQASAKRLQDAGVDPAQLLSDLL